MKNQWFKNNPKKMKNPKKRTKTPINKKKNNRKSPSRMKKKRRKSSHSLSQSLKNKILLPANANSWTVSLNSSGPLKNP